MKRRRRSSSWFRARFPRSPSAGAAPRKQARSGAVQFMPSSPRKRRKCPICRRPGARHRDRVVDVRGSPGNRSGARQVPGRIRDGETVRSVHPRESQSPARRPLFHGARHVAPPRGRIFTGRDVPRLSLQRLHEAAAAGSGQTGHRPSRVERDLRYGDAHDQRDSRCPALVVRGRRISRGARWPSHAAGVDDGEGQVQTRRRRISLRLYLS